MATICCEWKLLLVYIYFYKYGTLYLQWSLDSSLS